jgi:hypothetical protein
MKNEDQLRDQTLNKTTKAAKTNGFVAVEDFEEVEEVPQEAKLLEVETQGSAIGLITPVTSATSRVMDSEDVEPILEKLQAKPSARNVKDVIKDDACPSTMEKTDKEIAKEEKPK